MLVLLALLAGTDPAPADVALLRVRATAAYRAHRYAEACPAFAEAARLAPGDAAIAADLGLCLEKLGRRDEAIAEARRAVGLARPGTRDPERVRGGAYRHLAAMGAAIPVPGIDGCGPLPPAPGCAARLHACARRVEVSGKGGGAAYAFLVVARRAEDAADPDVEVPTYLDDEDAPAPSWRRPPGVVSVPLEAREKRAGGAAGGARCTLVSADACGGLVASVCEDPGAEKPRAFVHELAVGR